MKSSYANNNYSNLFRSICFALRPKKILEFGILEGYSLMAFVEASDADTQIVAYDLFDDFPYNAADFKDITDKFKDFPNVTISKADLYGAESSLDQEDFDLIHIDIANNGNVFEYVFENYMSKLKQGGVCILEGGSEDRDTVSWMEKYNKPKIVPIIKKYSEKFDIVVLEDYPSVTLVRKRR